MVFCLLEQLENNEIPILVNLYVVLDRVALRLAGGFFNFTIMFVRFMKPFI